MKVLLKSIIPAVLGVVLSASFASAQQFTDLPEDHWAYKQINQLAKEEIVVGYPDGTYRPDEQITRAEFASMAVKALHQENAALTDIINYSDVPENSWAWANIQRAVRFDLIGETADNKFRPEDSVTRAECLEIVINSLTTETLTEEEAKAVLEARYIDTHLVPQWILIKAGKAEKLGIMVTIPTGEAVIAATRPATRAEVAAFLYNMIEQVKLAPNKKIAEVMQPIKADGLVLENAVVKGTVGIIPAGTIIPVTMLTNLDSQTSTVETPFSARISQNLVTKEKYLLINQGAILKGILLDRKKAFIIIRNGKLLLNTKTITTVTPQIANFNGFAETNPELTIWRKIFKGLKVNYSSDETIDLEVLNNIKIDLTNGRIID